MGRAVGLDVIRAERVEQDDEYGVSIERACRFTGRVTELCDRFNAESGLSGTGRHDRVARVVTATRDQRSNQQ